LHTYFCVAQSCKRRAYFYIYSRLKLKKGKFFKTLQQNNAVLSRAALSGTKAVPDRARRGYLASCQGITLGVKGDIEKNFSICPKLLINAELSGLVLARRLKKGYHQIWEADVQPLGPMFQHLIIS
jgi:hypothetical protein